ncbi:MAG: SDR family oxidoreductase [Melioribacteraceae bacterium]
MKILITGNMGYVGSRLIKYLRIKYPESKLIGYDIGYFKDSLTNTKELPELLLNVQYNRDLRNFDYNLLDGIDHIIHLAAISNDPISNTFEKVTYDVNYHSSVKLAQMALKYNVKSFVFASSCSVYGNGTLSARTELNDLNPLTAYSKSKILTENEIKDLAKKNFSVSILRFATACGMSDRLRLDLVLNDFVASAITNKKIQILSDGSPWRPLIDVEDMCRAIDWAMLRKPTNNENLLTINVGKNENNFQIKDLAYAVKEFFPEIEVTINSNALPDKRSYKVDFSLFSSLAENYIPQKSIEATINDIKSTLIKMNFNDPNFRESNLIRLQKLNYLINQKKINNNLEWIE